MARAQLQFALFACAAVAVFALGLLVWAPQRRVAKADTLETAAHALADELLQQTALLEGVLSETQRRGGPHRRATGLQRQASREARTVATELSRDLGRANHALFADAALVKADYDVLHPMLPDPLLYAYPTGKQPPFRYPEDTDEARAGGGINSFNWQLLSYMPRTYFMTDFLDASDAREIVLLARPKMKRSQVQEFKDDQKDKKGDAETLDDVRTSEGAWLTLHHKVVRRVKERIAQISGYPVSSMEDMQVLKYEVGQLYESHHDFFDPKYYGKQSWNRVATFYMFLTDDFEGGEFALPLANARDASVDFKKCEYGLRVEPRVGSGVLFYGMRPDMVLDKYSLHTGCPVTKGTKWSAVVWIDHKGEAFSDIDDRS
ncbi:putative prolyl 4-hydroxylase 9 [Diplonema papillatum]|nr:putative prolyl 4-hydroxylase 9 [Diplonema papillatum]|eukprot:gene13655-21004_t